MCIRDRTKNRASEDPLNYPIKLNNKVAYVMGVCLLYTSRCV